MSSDDELRTKLNPDAVLDEEAQKRVYNLASNKIEAIESLLDALKLLKARANRKQLTVRDVMRLQDLLEEIK